MIKWFDPSQLLNLALLVVAVVLLGNNNNNRIVSVVYSMMFFCLLYREAPMVGRCRCCPWCAQALSGPSSSHRCVLTGLIILCSPHCQPTWTLCCTLTYSRLDFLHVLPHWVQCLRILCNIQHAPLWDEDMSPELFLLLLCRTPSCQHYPTWVAGCFLCSQAC